MRMTGQDQTVVRAMPWCLTLLVTCHRHNGLACFENQTLRCKGRPTVSLPPIRPHTECTMGQAEALGSAYDKNPQKQICHFAYPQGGADFDW